ncbi:histidine phosphatase family protein [Actibacterium sp. 188UL27-1]|uniref:SixA phosphatase family protein n=1 Tax=Actibacterium sp. 188UL27-1 TaxID=2786961 RepID=UPI00195BBCB5|nr:histidine phosphatase family protein [Actibacterium sp. 188UL27-1]MBM7069963.1 histidine phosphatase family protein [Actibacterium sp. 188UL27-1]
MTKQLILMRHAKSSWSDVQLDDHDRPLNGRGEGNAEALGRWMASRQLRPDVILCSTARRTQETADHLNLSVAPTLKRSLYHATEDNMLDLIGRQSAASVMLIGHNPGIGALAGLLAKPGDPHPRFHDYPTGATTVFTLEIESWDQIGPGSGNVISFVIPKEL